MLDRFPGDARSPGRATSRPSTTSPTTGRAATPCSRPTSSPPTRAPASSTPRSPSARTTSALGEQYGITLQNPVRPDGTFDERITDFAGRFVKEADADIVEALRRARPAAPRRDATSTPTRTAGAATRRSSTTRSRAGTSAPPRSATGCSPRTRRSAGTPSTSSTGASASGSRATSTGRSRASATGARRCRSGSASPSDCEERFCAGSLADLRERGGEVPDDLHRPYIDEVVAALRGLRRRDAPGRGGDRRLVRLGLDAVRAVPLPVRGRGAVRGALPGRLHQRGDRPDPRLVLLAARGLDPGLRPAPATATASASG